MSNESLFGMGFIIIIIVILVVIAAFAETNDD